jgi:hypothetical protein
LCCCLHSPRATNARTAEGLLNPVEMDLSYPQNLMTSFNMEDVNIAYEDVFNYIGSRDSIVPSSVFFKLLTRIGGDTSEQLNVSNPNQVQVLCK